MSFRNCLILSLLVVVGMIGSSLASKLPVESFKRGIGKGLTSSQCYSSRGSQLCCNTLNNSNDPATAFLLGFFGIAPVGTGQIGLNCISSAVQGGDATPSCTQQSVCCQNSQFNSLIGIGCTPITA
jgi:hypothetical protein